MNPVRRGLGQVGDDLGLLPGAWSRFWHQPRSIAPLAFVRIALGLMIALWGLSLLPDARAFLGPDGVLPDVPQVRLRTGILQLWQTDAAAITVVAALIPAGLAVAVGLWTRPMTVLSFVLLLSVGRRDPHMLNSGDGLLRHATLFLACTPAGQVFSVDRWRRHRDRFWEVPHASPWGLRLLQLQLSIVYLFSTLEKLRGSAWLDGTALADAWRITDLARVGLPLPIYDSLLLANVLTFSTLFVEAALAVLIWNRRARPYVLAAGVGLHLGIELTMSVGFFSAVAVSLYLAFVADDVAEGWLDALRRRFAGRAARSVPERDDRAWAPPDDADRAPVR